MSLRITLVFCFKFQWNSVYGALGRLIVIFDNRDNLKAFYGVCTILTMPLITNNDIAYLKRILPSNAPICTALDKLQNEEYA